MGETVQADDGAQLPIDSLPQLFAFDGAFVSTITTSYAGSTYQQTFYNNGTNITFVSGWINIGETPPQQYMAYENGDIMTYENGDIMTYEAA